jgi:cell division protein FtsW
MSVQPSEFLKPVAAVFLASLLATLKNGGGKWMKTKIALMFAGIIATLMSQTDFGMSMTFAAIFGVEVFLAGAKKRWILALVAVLALGSFASYRHIPQVHNRIERFLSDNPEDRRQIDASLEAIRGAGLLSGGRGALKQYIPDVHTDFIFSAMVESFGILLSVMVLGACFWVSAIVLDRMKRIRDPFASLACGGIVGFLTFQVCVNIASALGLIPPKGMTLPFISSGGSSLISSCMAMGIVLSLLRGQEGAK